MNEMNTTKIGKVKFWNAGKGYGFITDDETGTDIFVHATGLSGQEINENDKVQFETQEGKKGLNAINVQLV